MVFETVWKQDSRRGVPCQCKTLPMLQIKPQYVPTRYGIIEATTMQRTGTNELREECSWWVAVAIAVVDEKEVNHQLKSKYELQQIQSS